MPPSLLPINNELTHVHAVANGLSRAGDDVHRRLAKGFAVDRATFTTLRYAGRDKARANG